MLFTIATAAEKGDISRPNIYARQQQDTQPTSSSSGSSPTSSATSSSSSSTPVPVSPPSPVQAPAQKPGSTGGTVIGPGGIIIQPHSGNSTSNSTIIGPNSVIDPRRPVSRLSMVQPKQNTVNPPLFPVGSNIVFEWLFDNATLVFPPANLTVEISLTSNPKMIWPVANVSGTATSVVWNTATVTNPSLFMGYYTLSVYDTKIGKQGVATSGHLMPYSDLQFGMNLMFHGPELSAKRAVTEPSSNGATGN
ncbi:hypothetical protein CPB97_006478 [Podila verticillata]|nr:hypothetical protein CPB97_006478 [Podila verticillata]